ncbi:MAG: S41 family peptidase [Brevinematales bacterium]|nr:S41 family peptidase [Brevinematales bacterium]
MNLDKKNQALIVFIVVFVFGIGLITANRIFFMNNLAYGGSPSTNAMSEIADPEDDNYFKYFPMFKKAYYTLKKEYYDKDKVTAKNLFYGAIKGMLMALDDPYSVFMEPQLAKEFNIDMSAKFGGLGIHIDIRDGWLTIISPIEDTPAWKAGLKPNDKIVEIDGVTTRDITVMEAIAKLRGKPGTKVTITVVRQGIDEPFKVTLVREEIIIKTVKSAMIEEKNKNYGYVRISEFSMPTADELKKHLKDILSKKPSGLIIDLRGNPGGLLNVVVYCVDCFLDEGLIVYTRGRLSDNNSEFYAKKENTIVPMNMPVIVMIDQGSASASEIFAGAMKDTGRAVIVGMKSFGKGSVQKPFDFPEDSSIMKYTVAKYFTPGGNVIDKIGLQPDVEEKNWYEKIDNEEKNDLYKIQSTNFIKDFVAKHPKPTDADLNQFRQDMLKLNYKISMISLKWLVKMKIHESDMPNVYDLEFDDQLVKALNILDNFQNYAKKVKVYDNPK